MKKHFLSFLISLLVVGISIPSSAEDTKEARFKSILGFKVSTGVPIATIQHRLGATKAFQSGEFEKAICYYRNQTAVTLISFQSDEGTSAPDTFDMYEISLASADLKNLCSAMPDDVPDAAFEPGGIKLGISIDQFEALTGATAADEMPNGVGSVRVFQKYFSTAHYIYASFDDEGLTSFRVQ